MRDDHHILAVHTVRSIAVMTAVIAVALLLTGRVAALSGLLAGAVVGIADVLLLARSLTRFGGGAAPNARALGTGMLSRFLAIGVLLGMVLCIRSINPLAALVGFLLMPASVALTGSRMAHQARLTEAAHDRH